MTSPGPVSLGEALFAASRDALFLIDPAARRLVGLNPRAEALCGRGRAELVGLPVERLFEPVSDDLLAPPVGAPGRSTTVSLRLGATGQPVPLQVRATRVLAAGAVFVLLEVHESQVAVRKPGARLPTTNPYLRLLLDQMPVVVWSVDPDYRFTVSAGAGLAGLGFVPGEVVGQTLADVFGTDDPSFPAIAATRSALAGTPVTYDFAWRGRNYTVRMEPLRDPGGPITGAVGVALDVTDRRRAERDSSHSEERFRRVFDCAPLGVALVSLEGKILRANPALCAMLGYTEAELCARGIEGVSHPDDFPEDLRRGRQVLAGEAPSYQLEKRYLRRDGSVVYGRLTGAALRDATGQVVAGIGMVEDISERRRAIDELRRSEERHRLLFERNLAGVFRSAPDGRLLDVNDSFAAIFGYTDREELLRAGAHALYFDPADREALLALLRQRGRVSNHELQMRRRDGQPVWCLENVSLMTSADEEPFLEGTVIDVTERRRLEERLRQAQKLEAVEQLAGGIAHDFNNLLTVIVGSLGLLRGRTEPAAEGLLDQTERAAWRAAELTHQLLGFARRVAVRPGPVDVPAAVNEAVAELRRDLDPRLRVEVRLEPGAGPVRAGAEPVQQALLNLCLNARDAMPGGGTLTVEAANVTLGEADDRHPEARPGEYVRLSVADTGGGIAPEHRGRLFEPFFTTKPVGQGTGLGLAMVHGMIRSLGGWVDWASEVGVGTRFDLYLPRATAESKSAPVPAPAAPPVAGCPRILLADDEPLVRAVARAVLEKEGYEVLPAEDGQEAVDLFRREAGRIDLVILDLTMPRLTGHEALRAIRTLDPRARVILSSGYSREEIDPEPGLEVSAFVTKPYRPQALLDAVRQALGEAE